MTAQDAASRAANTIFSDLDGLHRRCRLPLREPMQNIRDDLAAIIRTEYAEIEASAVDGVKYRALLQDYHKLQAEIRELRLAMSERM